MTERYDSVDPTGAILVELRTYLALVAGGPAGARKDAATVVGDRIFSKRPYGRAPAIAIARTGPSRRLPRAPVGTHRFTITSWGRDEIEATTIAGLVSDCLYAKGPRRRNAGVALYVSQEEIGGQAGLDPDTNDPFELGIYTVSVALAQAEP